MSVLVIYDNFLNTVDPILISNERVIANKGCAVHSAREKSSVRDPIFLPI